MTNDLFARDGFVNVVSALGAANYKTSAGSYTVEQPSQGELEAAYRGSTWFGKIVDIPADDATREWRLWKAKNADVTSIEAEEKRLNVVAKVHEALKWARLYGGSVIIPGGLPGNMEQPLATESVRRGSLDFLNVLQRHEIQAEGLVRDPLSPFHGEPEMYVIQSDAGETRIHPSRIIRFNGRRVQSRVTVNDGWGDSVWLHLRDAVRDSDKASAVISALLEEAKIDVVKIPNLTTSMATSAAEAAMIRRFQIANVMKSVANTLVMDGSDEWNQKTMNWSGLPDVVMTVLQIMAGAADIPLTRLIGRSPAGLNATGEGDLKNYYDMVKARQQLDVAPALARLDEMLIRSATGQRDPDTWYEWRPLWQPSEKERAEAENLYSQAVQRYVDSAILPSRELMITAQTRMIESGSWPGLEQAMRESAAAGPRELDMPGGTEGED